MHVNQPPIGTSGWETTPPDAKTLLAPYRSRIDDLDAQIVALLGERFDVVRQVAALKARHGIHPVLADRLKEVVERARSRAEHVGIDPDVAEGIYRLLLDAACRLEADLIPSGEAG